MRYRRLDLNLLLALDVLLAERSVTRAAAKLNVTQPAMSGSLARLRDYFEDPLIVQVGRTMELTPLAQALVAPVRDIMTRIDAAITTDPQFEPASSKRHFSIAASDYVVRVLLLDVLREIRRMAPQITFEIRQTTPRGPTELEAGELDMMIFPQIDVLDEHPHETVFEDTYVVAAWKGSEAIRDDLTFDEYMGFGHVVFRSEYAGSPFLDRWFSKQYGDSRRIEVAVHSFMLVVQAVIGTDRIATVPARLAAELARNFPLRIIQPPIELPRLVEVLQWPSHREVDPAHRWIREQIRAVAARLPPV
jgi:DNA-binding transcriptional LysR family regulator